MSLLPTGDSIPESGRFQVIDPLKEEPVSALEPAPSSSKRALKQAPEPDAADEQGDAPAAPQLAARVPLPPRRPFNLGFSGRKQKVLLARLPRKRSFSRRRRESR